MSEHVRIYRDLEQGSEEWAQLRCGMLTASEIGALLTPAMKPASNEKERAHLYELLQQRIKGYAEPGFVSYDMERGKLEEIEARRYYERDHGPVEQVGFIVNTRHGFRLGYSPDGLVDGPRGNLEIKSRKARLQLQHIIEVVWGSDNRAMPLEHVAQVQSGLIASEREFCDFVSFSGGLPYTCTRIWPDPKVQELLLDAGMQAEIRLRLAMATYRQAKARFNLPDTEPVLFGEIDVAESDS